MSDETLKRSAAPCGTPHEPDCALADRIEKEVRQVQALKEDRGDPEYWLLQTFVANADTICAALRAPRLPSTVSATEPTITYHGSGEDLATDVHALLTPKERQRFAEKWQERDGSPLSSTPESNAGVRAVAFFEWWDAQDNDSLFGRSDQVRDWAWRAWNAAFDRTTQVSATPRGDK